MSRSRRNRKSSMLRNLQNTSSKTIPVVGKGLKKVGTTAKGLAVKSVPVIEKGMSNVYGTLASGFDLGIKGIKNVASGVKSMTYKKKSKRRHSRGGKSRRR